MDVNGNGWIIGEYAALVSPIRILPVVDRSHGSSNTYTHGQTRWEGSLPPNYGNTVTITANPPTNYHFTSCSVSGMLSVTSLTVSPTTLTVNGPGTLTANFAPNPPSRQWTVLIYVAYDNNLGRDTPGLARNVE